MEECGITNCFENAVMLDEPCYFCGNDNTVGFSEHYHFCPSCSAIYTFLIVHNKNCNHINDRTPVAIREPWFESARNGKKYIVDYNERADVPTYKCSICAKPVHADGW